MKPGITGSAASLGLRPDCPKHTCRHACAAASPDIAACLPACRLVLASRGASNCRHARSAAKACCSSPRRFDLSKLPLTAWYCRPLPVPVPLPVPALIGGGNASVLLDPRFYHRFPGRAASARSAFWAAVSLAILFSGPAGKYCTSSYK